MAGITDFRVSCALFAHPKFLKLLRRHGDHGGVSLLRLFGYTAQNKPDGNLAGMSAEDVEIAAGWSGQLGHFCGALQEVGFLDGQAGEYRMHDWAEHQPWAVGAQARSDSAKRAALKKNGYSDEDIAKVMKRKGKKRCSLQATGMPTGSDAHAAPVIPQCSISLPSPSPTPSLFRDETPPASQGAAAPSTESIFGFGLELLKSKSVSEKAARSFLGLMRRDLKELGGDAKVLELLHRCEQEQILDPIPWLRKAMSAGKTPGKRGNGVFIGQQQYSENWENQN